MKVTIILKDDNDAYNEDKKAIAYIFPFEATRRQILDKAEKIMRHHGDFQDFYKEPDNGGLIYWFTNCGYIAEIHETDNIEPYISDVEI